MKTLEELGFELEYQNKNHVQYYKRGDSKVSGVSIHFFSEGVVEPSNEFVFDYSLWKAIELKMKELGYWK